MAVGDYGLGGPVTSPWPAVAIVLLVVVGGSAVASDRSVPSPNRSLAAESLASTRASPAVSAFSETPARDAGDPVANPPVRSSTDASAGLPSSLGNLASLVAQLHSDPYGSPLTSLPNLNLLEQGPSSLSSVYVPGMKARPAPMGLSDLGRGATAYSYNTSHFLGQVTLFAPPNVTDPGSAGEVDPGGSHLGYVGSMDEFSVQLNTVASNITFPGTSSGFFWSQNVVDWNDTGIHFVDDTFNLSGAVLDISPGTIYSGCNNTTSGVDGILLVNGILQCVGGTIPVSPAAYPVTLQLYNNASVNAQDRDQIAFGYRIIESGLGEVFTGVSDVVVFNNPGAPSTPPATAPGFSVDGFSTTPLGLYRDAELDLVGDIGGDNAVFSSFNGTLELEYSNASAGGWRSVPSAYDFGVDTGETSEGLAATWEPNDTEAIHQGPSLLYGLWNAVPAVSIPSGALHLEGSIEPSYGFVFVSNAAPSAPPPAGWPDNLTWLPTNPLGQFDTYLPPAGSAVAPQYYVQAYADGSSETNGTPITASTANYTLDLPSSPTTLDAPLYATGNDQADALARNVSGSSSVPYLFTNLSPDLAPAFLQPNDYGFPSFETALFQGVTEPIRMNHVGGGPGTEIFGGSDDVVTNESLETVVLWHDADATVRSFQAFNGSGSVYVLASTGTSVQGGTVTGGGWVETLGVGDIGSTGTVVDGLTVTGSFTVGIISYSSRNATYTSLNGSLGAEGILGGSYAENGGVRNAFYDLPGAAGASISSMNVSDGSVFGVLLADSTNVSLSNDSVGDSSEGIILHGVTHSSVRASTLSDDTSPLLLEFANRTIVSGVDLSYDKFGAYLEGSSNSSITRSVFFSNSNDAVTVAPDDVLGTPSTGNLVYDNSFLLNNGSTLAYSPAAIQASSEPGNSFNLSNVGNCWADWHSVAEGALAPYIVSSGVADEHPIACPGPNSYLVSFEETGLAAKGKHWLVAFAGISQSSGGTPKSSTVTSLELPVPNGTYAFVVAGPAGERASAPVGTVVVEGRNVTEAEAFSPGSTRTLTFHETGLGSGSSWCIALAGTYSRCSVHASIAFKNLTPATYPYSIGQEQFTPATTLVKLGKVWVPETQGTVTLTRSETVSLEYAYAVYFDAEGLAPGTSWGVKVGGVSQSTTGANLTFYLLNGTSKFKVLPVAGYEVTPTAGRVLVSGEVDWIELQYEST